MWVEGRRRGPERAGTQEDDMLIVKVMLEGLLYAKQIWLALIEPYAAHVAYVPHFAGRDGRTAGLFET